MRIGRYRHRVTFQNKNVEQNEYGEEVITWEDAITLWARVEPLSGREYVESSQAQADVSARIYTRHSGTAVVLSPEMRAVHDSRNYEIRAIVNPSERDREYQIMVKEAID